jgi:hypothetical protein
MKRLFLRWRDRNHNLDEVENLLRSNLVPVIPSQEFVAGLRKNLLFQFPQEVEEMVNQQRTKLQTLLVITGGVFGGALIVLSGVRGVISLMSVFVLLISWLRNHQKFQQA